MKKTLALALVAAMTISMASMTAFAGVSYSDGKADADLTKVYATITLSDDDLATLKAAKDADTEGTSGITAVDTDAKTAKLTYKALKALSEKNALGDMKDLNTATKTFVGWNDPTTTKPDAATTGTEDKVKDTTEFTFANVDGKATAYSQALYKTTSDDAEIAKNLENIEKNKQSKADAKSEDDRLAELDKKYNADGKNGYDKTSKEDKELKGEAVLKEIVEKNAQDYAWHAIQVAGVTDDTTKTWVYDVNLPVGTALYAGKTARTTLTIDGVKGDLSKFGVKVYHIEGWCKAVPVKNVDVKGNTVTFWASDFSPYVVTIGDGVASTGTADASNPSTGDFSAVPVALLAAAALGATGFVAYKKRKAE